MKVLGFEWARFCLVLGCLLTVGCGTGTIMSPNKVVVGSKATPNISMLSPNSIPVGSPGFTMTINGSNLGTDSVAFFNGNAQHTTFVSSNQIMVVLNATDLQNAGMIPMFVRTQGMNSNTLDFDVMVQ